MLAITNGDTHCARLGRVHLKPFTALISIERTSRRLQIAALLCHPDTLDSMAFQRHFSLFWLNMIRFSSKRKPGKCVLSANTLSDVSYVINVLPARRSQPLYADFENIQSWANIKLSLESKLASCLRTEQPH